MPLPQRLPFCWWKIAKLWANILQTLILSTVELSVDVLNIFHNVSNAKHREFNKWIFFSLNKLNLPITVIPDLNKSTSNKFYDYLLMFLRSLCLHRSSRWMIGEWPVSIMWHWKLQLKWKVKCWRVHSWGRVAVKVLTLCQYAPTMHLIK